MTEPQSRVSNGDAFFDHVKAISIRSPAECGMDVLAYISAGFPRFLLRHAAVSKLWLFFAPCETLTPNALSVGEIALSVFFLRPRRASVVFGPVEPDCH
jgi:hypothetical protein